MVQPDESKLNFDEWMEYNQIGRDSANVKVLHVITGLKVGGAETALWRLIGDLKSVDSEHIVISLTDGGYLAECLREVGIQVILLGMKQGRLSLDSIRRLRKLIISIAPDIINSWMYHANLASTVATLGTRYRSKVIWGVRSSIYDISKEKMLTRQTIRAGALLSKKVEIILYNSYTSRKRHEKYGYCSSVGYVIPNGFDLKIFYPNIDARRHIRSSLNISERSIVIGLIARLHPIKDHETFFKAAKCIWERFPDTHFLLAGSGVTRENPAIARLVRGIRSKGRLHLLGERHDISSLTAALDIACSTSRGEAFPNTIAEAMASGVPCIGTDVGDTREIIGGTGLVIHPGDVEELARGWCYLIELGNDQRRALGVSARRRVAERYSLSAMARQYRDVYSRVIGGNDVRNCWTI